LMAHFEFLHDCLSSMDQIVDIMFSAKMLSTSAVIVDDW